MVRDTTRVFVHIHPDLIGYDGIHLFAEEFKAYKELAFDYAKESDVPGTCASEFLPTLTEEDQKQLPPDQSLFGRDRIFKKGQKAANDPLYHVHIFSPEDDHCIWHGINGEQVNQWKCVSDAALIYAYMKTESDDFNYLLLEIIQPDGAHERYEQEDSIIRWRRKVEAFRTKNRIQ